MNTKIRQNRPLTDILQDDSLFVVDTGALFRLSEEMRLKYNADFLLRAIYQFGYFEEIPEDLLESKLSSLIITRDMLNQDNSYTVKEFTL